VTALSSGGHEMEPFRWRRGLRAKAGGIDVLRLGAAADPQLIAGRPGPWRWS